MKSSNEKERKEDKRKGKEWEEQADDLKECFVIQPYDSGVYDSRYRETIKPALEEAGVKPVRADEILGLNPVIEKIEQAIKDAPICLAEVSEDNPNVWFELGYALALSRPTVIICESRRTSLPFDVQHRPFILYRTETENGFKKLRKDIVDSIQHQIRLSTQEVKRVPVLKESEAAKADLKDYEVTMLAEIFDSLTSDTGGIESQRLKYRMELAGFSSITVALGIETLSDRGFISSSIEVLANGLNEYATKVYYIADLGKAWIIENQGLLRLRDLPDDLHDD